jgi:hypothetical protein
MKLKVLNQLMRIDGQGPVQLKEHFADGAVMVQWGKRDDAEDADVWFLNKLEVLARGMACMPEKYESPNNPMVCCHVTMPSTVPVTLIIDFLATTREA